MKYTAAVTAVLAAVATASPTMVVDKRQDAGAAPKAPSKGKASGGASSLSQFSQGGCKGTVMIFSRGTGEPGNVGFIIGPPLFAAVSKGLGGDVAVEGIVYPADVGGNLGAKGASDAGINAGIKLFKEVHQKCPQSAIVSGGYSQGAALQHRAVEGLPKEIQDHIAAVVLFGDTKNKQEGGKIKGFPAEKAKVYCNPNDGVCGGALNVNAGHLSYTTSIQPAANWIVGRVQAWKKAKGISDSSPPLDPSAPTELGAAPAGGSAKGGAPKGKGKGGGPPKASAPPPAAAAPPAADVASPAASPMAGMDSMAGMSHGIRRI